MFAYIRNNFVHTVSTFSDMQWRDGEIVECPDHIDYGWRYEKGEWIEPSLVTQSVSARTLSKIDYMDRFTDAELAGIYAAAKTSIEVEIWLERFKLAQDVNLDDPRTQSGLQALEAVGLIGEGRAAEILS